MYDIPFKLQVCKAKSEHPEKSFKQIGAEYGVGASAVSNWYKEYLIYGDDAFNPEAQKIANEKEMLRIIKENEDLKEENEILKKAMAFFAKTDL